MGTIRNIQMGEHATPHERGKQDLCAIKMVYSFLDIPLPQNLQRIIEKRIGHIVADGSNSNLNTITEAINHLSTSGKPECIEAMSRFSEKVLDMLNPTDPFAHKLLSCGIADWKKARELSKGIEDLCSIHVTLEDSGTDLEISTDKLYEIYEYALENFYNNFLNEELPTKEEKISKKEAIEKFGDIENDIRNMYIRLKHSYEISKSLTIEINE